MHPLYDEAIDVGEKIKEARLEVVQLTMALAQAEYDLAVVKARIERSLIKKVGDEKKLGPTVEARERIFTLARDADEEYLGKLKRRNEASENLERAKIEATALRDKLNIIVTTMKATGSTD